MGWSIADAPPRFHHRPAAQPPLHPGLVGLDRRPRRGDQPRHAGPPPRDHAHRRDLPVPPALRRHPARVRPELEPLEGGDVLLLAPDVLAVGVGERTTPAGAERLARRVFAAGLAHTILVVPIAQERATMHLDTVCTMVDVDTVLMYPQHGPDAAGVHGGRRRRGRAPARRAGTVPARRGRRDGSRHPAGDRHRTGPGHRRTGAVGRRQQHPGASRPGSAWRTSGTSRPTPNWSGPASR